MNTDLFRKQVAKKLMGLGFAQLPLQKELDGIGTSNSDIWLALALPNMLEHPTSPEELHKTQETVGFLGWKYRNQLGLPHEDLKAIINANREALPVLPC